MPVEGEMRAHGWDTGHIRYELFLFHSDVVVRRGRFVPKVEKIKRGDIG